MVYFYSIHGVILQDYVHTNTISGKEIESIITRGEKDNGPKQLFLSLDVKRKQLDVPNHRDSI